MADLECEHGRLARSCVHCELAEERAENERLRAAAQAVVDDWAFDPAGNSHDYESWRALRDVLNEKP